MSPRRGAASPPAGIGPLPMLCGATTPPASLDGWQAEPKWDGIRAIVATGPGGTVVANRSGGDVTAAYPELAGLGRRLPHEVVLDGEVVALDGAGRSSFERLQRRMHVRRPSPELVAEVPVRFIAFDVLRDGGDDLVDLPLVERRARLEPLAAAGIEVSPLMPAAAGSAALLEACRDVGLEGFVAKRLDSRYEAGRRSPAWVKVKAVRRRELVVGGWLEGRGGRSGGIGALAIGWVDPSCRSRHPDGPCLRWAGQVGSGLSGPLLEALEPVRRRFAVDESPFLDAPRGAKVHWLAPVLVVEVAFTEVTSAGTLRHPALKGLRPDLLASEVGPGEGLGEDGR